MKQISMVMLLALIACAALPAQERNPKAGKGIALFSWQDEKGNYLFAVFPDTNRITKTEASVKKEPISGVSALEQRFRSLAVGEEVRWANHSLPGFTYPDEKTIGEILAAAVRAEVLLDSRLPGRRG
jgi:hypothetical protein